MKRTLVLLGVLMLGPGSGCCLCRHGNPGYSSYAAAPVYTAPPAYSAPAYAAPTYAPSYNNCAPATTVCQPVQPICPPDPCICP